LSIFHRIIFTEGNILICELDDIFYHHRHRLEKCTNVGSVSLCSFISLSRLYSLKAFRKTSANYEEKKNYCNTTFKKKHETCPFH